MSLFGHLALRFGSQPENLATEGLGYILGKSPAACAGFVASLGEAAVAIPSGLRFVTQFATEDQGRPDLAGLDEANAVCALVEAKFWAGFTDHQPVHYLDQLPPGGVLVVVCPNARLMHVWRELLARLRTANRRFEEKSTPGEVGHAVVDGKHVVLQSWRRALNAIRLELSGQPELLADVAQIDGLCDRMDSDAFIPLTSEELTSKVYRRVHEFGRIVDDLTATLVAEETMSKKGGRSAAANGWYGRHARLRGVWVLLHVSTYKWTLRGSSPLWLTVFGKVWRGEPGPARKLFASYESADRGPVFHDHDGYPAIMLSVKAGAERIEIIKAVLEQLRQIGEFIAPLGAGPADSSTPNGDGLAEGDDDGAARPTSS